ncbi:hypothetical protein ABIA32_002682 [Streptacidiphilus sp. MAP12-20]
MFTAVVAALVSQVPIRADTAVAGAVPVTTFCAQAGETGTLGRLPPDTVICAPVWSYQRMFWVMPRLASPPAERDAHPDQV